MTCVAVTALLAVVVTIPFIVAYCCITSEQWFYDIRARPASQQVCDAKSPRPAPRQPGKLETTLAREGTRRNNSMPTKEDSDVRTADSRDRPASLEVRDESPRPAPRSPKKLDRESTRRNFSIPRKDDSSDSRTADCCSASVQTTSSRTPALSKRVQLDRRHIARQAPRESVFDVEADVAIKSLLEEQGIQLPCKKEHFPVTSPSATPELRRDLPYDMSNQCVGGAQSSCAAMRLSSTATLSSPRPGSTSSDIDKPLQTFQRESSSGAVNARRVRCSRGTFAYTRRLDLYTLPEGDSV